MPAGRLRAPGLDQVCVEVMRPGPSRRAVRTRRARRRRRATDRRRARPSSVAASRTPRRRRGSTRPTKASSAQARNCIANSATLPRANARPVSPCTTRSCAAVPLRHDGRNAERRRFEHDQSQRFVPQRRHDDATGGTQLRAATPSRSSHPVNRARGIRRSIASRSGTVADEDDLHAGALRCFGQQHAALFGR